MAASARPAQMDSAIPGGALDFGGVLMPEIPVTVWIFCSVSAVVLAVAGEQPNAPLFCRWPYIAWEALAHRSWRRSTPAAVRPDYARIARLERELGMVDEEPERPIRHGRTICLTKDCDGDTVETRTWQGTLATRIHHCEAP